MSEEFKYDVFLSHSSKDKPTVRELAERLRRDGLRVWLDEWEIQPGDPILLKIEEGLEQSRTLVLAMSANAFASEWVTLERQTAMFRDPTNQQRRFIPLRLDDAEIKDALRQFAYVDWRQRNVAQYAKLLAACRPPASTAEPGGSDDGEAAGVPLSLFTSLNSPLSRLTTEARRLVAVNRRPINSSKIWVTESSLRWCMYPPGFLRWVLCDRLLNTIRISWKCPDFL